MPRPEYIARVHGARYDLRTCNRNDKAAMLRNYHEALAEAALKLALAHDYTTWLKQERLPRIDRNKS